LASAEALIRLGDAEAARAVAALIGREDTVLPALELAREVQGEEIVRAAIARAVASARPDVREAAVGALGRQVAAAAVVGLTALIQDARLEGVATCALARSPSPAAMSAIEAMAAHSSLQRNAVRAYFERRSVRGEGSARMDSIVESLAQSKDGRDRAVAVEALIAFGRLSLAPVLGDSDPRVRLAAAIGILGRLDAVNARILLGRRQVEPDPTVREVLSNGLAQVGSDGLVSTATVLHIVEEGRADALLGARVLARRLDDRELRKLALPYDSPDAIMRWQFALGLGENASPDAEGQLVEAYRFEVDPRVRRALVRSLVLRTGLDRASEVKKVLEFASYLDPDAAVRAQAGLGLALAEHRDETAGRDVACFRAVESDGAKARKGLTATVVDAAGRALSIAFDDDGYALVPGLETGEVLVRLAPEVGSYDAHFP
jgi:hypothetical protein